MNNQVPKFSTTQQTNIVCHREYLGDLNTTKNFSNLSYPLNPGISTTFPWLTSIAACYQEYKFHGMIFEFRPYITEFTNSGTPGILAMGTNYNADAPLFTSKQQLENSEYSVSVKPTQALIHGIECEQVVNAPMHRYVRTGAVPSNQDLRLYDLGNTQIVTQGSTDGLAIGELYVSYCVEFFKPILPLDIGGTTSTGKVGKSGVTNSNPMGNVIVSTSGSLTLSVTNTTLSFVANPSQYYLLTFTYNGGTVAAFSAPSVTLTNCVLKSFFRDSSGGANDHSFAPASGSTASWQYIAILQSSLSITGTVSFAFGTGGNLPTVPGFIDIIVSELDVGITF